MVKDCFPSLGGRRRMLVRYRRNIGGIGGCGLCSGLWKRLVWHSEEKRHEQEGLRNEGGREGRFTNMKHFNCIIIDSPIFMFGPNLWPTFWVHHSPESIQTMQLMPHVKHNQGFIFGIWDWDCWIWEVLCFFV